MKAIDRIGEKYGKLNIIGVKYSEKEKRNLAICECECGNIKIIDIRNLTSGRTKSCGCLHKENTARASIKHGMYKSRLNKEYRGIKQRCYNSNNTRYKYYGERGISVCDEWLGENGFINFMNWSLKNGYSDELTIDRIDVNKNYEPSNCRWISMKKQARNRRIKENNKSGYTGVQQRGKRWRAFITTNYKTIHLGTFDTIEEAIKARKNAEIKYWKEKS